MHTKLWIGYEVFSHLNKDAYFFLFILPLFTDELCGS